MSGALRRLRKKPLVLLVEDDPDSQGMLRAALAKHFRIVVASSASEARRVLRVRPSVSLVLMDLSLRGDEDGIELTRSLRADPAWRRLPIIATTAHALPKDRKSALEAGCDAYFAKPLPLAELRAAMWRLLRR